MTSMTVRKSGLGQSFSLLYRYPAFSRIWFGRLISLFGDAFALVALPWFVLQVTGSGTMTAGILLTLQLPAVVSSMVIHTDGNELAAAKSPREHLGRVFGARSTLVSGGSPLGLAIGAGLLAIIPSSGVIAFSAVACILVGIGGLASRTLRDLSLPPANFEA